MLTTKLTWTGGLRFEGTGQFGHTIVTDGGRAVGGQESGHKPTELLLWGIAGCTGIDVVNILRKQRQELTGLEIEVTGRMTADYPKRFETIEIRYIVRGRNLDPQKVRQAVELSQGKYCSVSLTVKHETAVTTRIDIQDEEA